MLRPTSNGFRILGIAAAMALAGCEPEEKKVLDLEAPGVEIEVKESTDDENDGSVEIEAGPEANDPQN